MHPTIQSILDGVAAMRIDLPWEKTGDSKAIENIAQGVLKKLGLPGKVTVTKRYPACVQYVFRLDGSEVVTYKVYAKDGIMGPANVMACVEDLVNEALGRQHPELIPEIENHLQRFPSTCRWHYVMK